MGTAHKKLTDNQAKELVRSVRKLPVDEIFVLLRRRDANALDIFRVTRSNPEDHKTRIYGQRLVNFWNGLLQRDYFSAFFLLLHDLFLRVG